MTEPLTERSLAMALREMAYSSKITSVSRHRMSKELAEELIAEVGDGAYLYCLEKLANNTQNPLLWRDVLTYLDEMRNHGKDESIDGMGSTDNARQGSEQAQGARDDSENSHQTSR